jgi:hypothetical protein
MSELCIRHEYKGPGPAANLDKQVNGVRQLSTMGD